MITGANGQLGADLVTELKTVYDVIPVTHDIIDLCESEKVESLIAHLEPDILINTAAFHHVEKCEAESKKAYLVNADMPYHLASICASKNIKFIHFSTAYVFDGNQHTPYTEETLAHPLNEYGKSKLTGEKMVLSCNPNALIIRVSALYGTHPCRAKNGLNFVQLMLKLAREKGEVTVVNDEFVAPTYTADIARQIIPILQHNLTGIIHLNAEGSCSWYEFAEEIFRYTNTPVKLSASSAATNTSVVKRPAYSVLSNHVLQTQGLNCMPHWKEGLHQYLNSLNN